MSQPMAARSGVVFGGAHGIGAATSQALVSAGADVTIADIDGEAADRLAQSIRADGGRATAIQSDVRSDAAVMAALESAGRGRNAMDFVVHCPYADRRGAVDEVEDDDWRLVHAVVLESAMSVARAAVPLMKAGHGGSITYISSIQARQGHPRQAAYAAAKAGLDGLVRQMAVDAGPSGIRVNAVSPSLVVIDRNLPRLQQEPGRLTQWAEHFPLRRLCRPEEVAQAVLFLASDAASYVTGVVLPVDGGISIQSSLHAAGRAFEAGLAAKDRIREVDQTSP